MKPRLVRAFVILPALLLAASLYGQQVTYFPYLQPGDNGPLGSTDQIVMAWQTNETTPNPSAYRVEYGPTTNYGQSVTPSGRLVDNYLAADGTLPAIPTAYGTHTNYFAVLSGLLFDSGYFYRVSGPGMPNGGFTASFRTRSKSPVFSFAVEGDEGFFPTVPNATTIVDYEARIANLIFNSGNLSVPGVPKLPAAQFVLNSGDNIYTYGAEGSYRDFFFPVFNNDTASNETGAPIIRSILYYVVTGNHDVGSTGVNANILASNSAPVFGGNIDGGDALAYFNDLYFPLNGPTGVDIQYTWDGDSSVANGLLLQYNNQTYTSPAAIEALRASTTVNTGGGSKQQIDHMGNYSFDYGNAHFVFLDANPHLFDGNLPGGSPSTVPYPPAFTPYPTPLREWLIDDLDSSKQLWKFVVFHQPSFTSGDATLLDNQMRAIAKFLEDHGVNIVFNGHDHNYQRSLPLRATSTTASTPSTASGTPAVYVDQNFDGVYNTVPDGVLYIVEGAGGNRDFDNDFQPPRGSGAGVDQDDSATGTYTVAPGLTVQQGPADWLDTNLTNLEMINNFPNAGTGPKITARLKSKVFSFGHVVVNNNSLKLYQISEPLKSTSSATAADPAPYGTDVNGKPLNDPIADTVLDSTNGALLSAPESGQSALLDQWTVTKPDLSRTITAQLFAAPFVAPNGSLVYTMNIRNRSAYALNGTQVRFTLPAGVTLTDQTSDTLTVDGSDVVYTIGRLDRGAQTAVEIHVSVNSGTPAGSPLIATGSLTSGTALPLPIRPVISWVVPTPPGRP